jgi:hypothetical protein
MKSAMRYYEFLARDPFFFRFFGGQHVELTAIVRDTLCTPVRLDRVEQCVEVRGQVCGVAD